MKKLATTLVGLTLCASAHAEFWSGNDVYHNLSDPDPFTRGMATGFVIGVFDVGQRAVWCAPDTVTVGQVRDMAKSYLNLTPDVRHRPAESILRDLFKAAWPCPKTNRNTL